MIKYDLKSCSETVINGLNGKLLYNNFKIEIFVVFRYFLAAKNVCNHNITHFSYNIYNIHVKYTVTKTKMFYQPVKILELQFTKVDNLTQAPNEKLSLEYELY